MAIAARSASCMFDDLYAIPGTDPNFRRPRRTPARNSPFSGGLYSSVVGSEGGGKVDWSEPAGRDVSWSAMIKHTWGRQERVDQGVKALSTGRFHIPQRRTTAMQRGGKRSLPRKAGPLSRTVYGSR